MKEFKTPEIDEIKKPEPEGFKEIKPEKDSSMSELGEFWDKEFKDSDKTSLQEGQHEDKKGSLGEKDENVQKVDGLEPNTEIEKNGFKFKTDELGRVISAEGKLELPENIGPRNMPSMEKVGKGDEQKTDERFHLIARMFGAGDGIENLVAGDAELNHGDYLKMENKLKDAVKDGADVRFKVEPVYSKESNRPSEFRVSYTIDGERDTEVFKNGRGD